MMGTAAQPRFDGVVKIVRFNLQFYLLSVLALAASALLLASRQLPSWLALAVLCGAALVAFWTLSSLLVSWYVYDHVGVTRWQWLPGCIPSPRRRWLNIHAGLDESTSALRQLFPGTEGIVLDIYNSRQMTEPSIARARQMYPSAEPFRSADFDALPFPDSDFDTIFLLFAAHELRLAQHRTLLLKEAARILCDDGHVILVEHLRDWKNFVAFGPGFLHFHSRGSWLQSIHDAGLVVERAVRITPFVECFVLRKAAP